MKFRTAILSFAAVSMSGCSVLDMRDWREKPEDTEECVERVLELIDFDTRTHIKEGVGYWSPTYTYDVTKLNLEEIDAMSVPHTDEKIGTMRTSAFGASAPPRDAFMKLDVTADGAFYLGEDPALYRVLGRVATGNDVLQIGCEGQKERMRLIDLSLEPAKMNQPVGDDTNSEGKEKK